uniref:Uncharacterized protein n=1 Tax=Arundo donax TaxID=35708 RepID=A0A0A9GXP2_ARUDO
MDLRSGAVPNRAIVPKNITDMLGAVKSFKINVVIESTMYNNH